MLEPFIRVKHSKRATAAELVEHFPKKWRRFVDATGTDLSVFSAQPRSPKLCVLNMMDPSMGALIEQVRDSVGEVTDAARTLWEDLSREEFESVLLSDMPAGHAEAAAQRLYLNLLARPGATTFDPANKAAAFDWQLLADWSTRLQGVKLTQTAPLQALANARETDLVLVDTSAGVDLNEAVASALDCPGSAVILTTEAEDIPPLGQLQARTLERRRPGLQVSDVVIVKV